MQSLMIAAVPNVVGWLAISMAKVSVHRHEYYSNNKARSTSPNIVMIYDMMSPSFVGIVASFYGAIIGRFWRGNNILRGNQS